MNPAVTPEMREVMEIVHYRPAVSVIMPFEPKMSLKTELAHSLKVAAGKVEDELTENYPDEISKLVIQKLHNQIQGLNYNTHKKSIAIFVSPVFEKVLYLDIPVEEKIIIDESFEIRDLVYSKKQLHKYLVLVLSGKESRMYIGNTTNFARIVSTTPESVYAYMNDVPERVSNFSDLSKRKEVIMEKYLLHVDKGLELILNAYQLPLFVMGTDRILGHFKKITKHGGAVVEFIHGNYEAATIPELKKILDPQVADWKKVKEKDLLNRLEEAEGAGKLAKGIKEVWREAMSHKSRLLVLEKNYMFAAQLGPALSEIYEPEAPYHKFSVIKDAVDDVIEKVLEYGGDVEFVDEGVLNQYQHIALILYY